MATPPKMQNVRIDVNNGVALVTLTRSKSGNSLHPDLMKEWLIAMRWVRDEPSVRVIVQTGEGKFYTTGKELVDIGPSSTNNSPLEDIDEGLKIFKELNEVFITLPKPLIAAVNGPAAGYGTTSIALYDLVYAVPEAYFFTPFMKWGLCAEGCSSITFRHILGHQKASALLLAGERMTAQELCDAGLITKVVSGTNSNEEFLKHVMEVANRIASYPDHAVKFTKNLMKQNMRDELLAANIRECDGLRDLMQRPESLEAIQQFIDSQMERKKSKL